MIEMYDQSVRHYSGGLMAKFIRQPNLINEQYIVGRLGYVGSNFRNSNFRIALSSMPMLKKAIRYVLSKIKAKLILSEAEEVGRFRLDGEIHMWMYDRYSLGQLLKDCDFINIVKKNPFESDIPQWNEYNLDVKKNEEGGGRFTILPHCLWKREKDNQVVHTRHKLFAAVVKDKCSGK
jgi:hypothetical protein